MQSSLAKSLLAGCTWCQIWVPVMNLWTRPGNQLVESAEVTDQPQFQWPRAWFFHKVGRAYPLRWVIPSLNDASFQCLLHQFVGLLLPVDRCWLCSMASVWGSTRQHFKGMCRPCNPLPTFKTVRKYLSVFFDNLPNEGRPLLGWPCSLLHPVSQCGSPHPLVMWVEMWMVDCCPPSPSFPPSSADPECQQMIPQLLAQTLTSVLKVMGCWLTSNPQWQF